MFGRNSMQSPDLHGALRAPTPVAAPSLKVSQSKAAIFVVEQPRNLGKEARASPGEHVAAATLGGLSS